MKAIKTVYRGPTDTRGARISASDEDGNRVTIPYPHDAGMGQDAHARAAIALCKKMRWHGRLIGGALKACYVFVLAPSSAVFDAHAYGVYEV